jgi:hypothetical protein
MSFEEDYEDVLLSIESAIMGFYQADPSLIDTEVDTVFTWLVKYYQAKSQGRKSSYPQPKGTSANLLLKVQEICDIFVGENSLIVNQEKGEIQLPVKIRTYSEMVECLQRLKSSVKLWTK